MTLNMISSLSTGNVTFDVLFVIAFSVASILTTTLVFTTLRFWLQINGYAVGKQGREPPTLPYALPWVGSMLRMRNLHSSFHYALTKSNNRPPVTMRVGPIHFYFIFGPKQIAWLFKNGKSTSKVSASLRVLAASGMEGEDLGIFSEESGYAAKPRFDIEPAKRIWKNTHDLHTPFLSSSGAVDNLTKSFVQALNVQYDQEPLNQWTNMPMLEFLKDKMFRAATVALIGPRIFEVSPDIRKIFWAYDNAFLPLMMGLPRWVQPGIHRDRDNFLHAVQKWLNLAYDSYDFEADTDPEWEPNFGSAYFRHNFRVMANAGLSREGQAAAVLSLIWAVHSNSIPATAWVFLEVFQKPGLLERLRAEVATAATIGEDKQIHLDIPKLISLPLLTSIYLEVLRLRSSMAVHRQMLEDVELDGYTLKKGNIIMTGTWVPHQDEIWNMEGHGATEFWPERHVEMKQKGASAKLQYETAMRTESFFPYGGGMNYCAGRQFAKQEIMAAVAILVLKFELEPLDWVNRDGSKSDRVAQVDVNFAGSAMLPPDRDLMVRFRRTL